MNGVGKVLGDGRIMTLGFAGMGAFVGTVLLGLVLRVGDDQTIPIASPLRPDSLAPAPAVGVTGRLPGAIRESSGVAIASFDPTLLWTHNDGPDARVFLVRQSGALAGIVHPVGEEVDDLEDIDVGVCPASIQAPSCLYLADTGDNDRDRDEVSILVTPEPRPEAFTQSIRINVDVSKADYRYPDGPRDAEALAIHPDGRIWVITKGQEGAADLFRVPWPDESSSGDQRAVRIGSLPLDVENKEARITAAAFDDRRQVLAVRSDDRIFLVDPTDLSGFIEVCELTNAGQGEGVDFLHEDLLILTREGRPAPIEIVSCP